MQEEIPMFEDIEGVKQESEAKVQQLQKQMQTYSKRVILKKTIIHSHVNISGNTVIGKGNKIYPFASIGNDPQDLKYNGEETKLIIGDKNTIREYVTINPGTIAGGGETKIGNNCLFMISSHVAHDCNVGNNVIIANNVPLGGHVRIGNDAIIGEIQQYNNLLELEKWR